MTTAAPAPTTSLARASVHVEGFQSCDRCGDTIRAKWVAWVQRGADVLPLTMCNNHMTRNRARLEEMGARIEELTA